jgi:hypothetical protein
MADIDRLKHDFEEVRAEHFHLATLGAVPLRSTFLFETVLRACETLDHGLLRIPPLRRYAWIVVLRCRRAKERMLHA